MRDFANDYIKVLASDHETLDRGYALIEHLEELNHPNRPINYWQEGYLNVEVENYSVAITRTHRSYPTHPRLYLDTSVIKEMYTSDDNLVLGVEFDGREYVLTIDGSIVVMPAKAAQKLAAAAD